MPPRLSIVLPTYNRESTLARAVRSALGQVESSLEVIVVDDGSSDGTRALIETIADPRLRYMTHHPNRGGNYARNRGIEAALAPIVCFLDSDDEFLPGKASYVLDFFDRHPGIDGLLDSHLLVFEDGRASSERRNPHDLDPVRFRAGFFRGELSKPTPAISARRAALIDIGLFDETLRRRQDMDLLLRLTRRHAGASTDQVLWRKHWVEGAISADRENFVAALLAILDRHPEYASNPHYSVGLERDIVRHVAELAAAGRFSTAWRDLKRLRLDARVRLPALASWRRGWRIFRRRLVGARQR